MRTVVHEDEQVVDAPLRAEQVEVKRVALDDHWVEAPVPVRQEGDTTIVTLHEEVVVVETRLRATEEVHLIRRQATSSTREHVTLRREEALIERLDAAADDEEARVVGEVSLGKAVAEHEETVKDTVRRNQAEVETIKPGSRKTSR